MGIEAHMSESSDALPQSAKFFEISANLDGGTPFGMLMWGLCLRHGWGVPKDEKQGFVWLRQACEIAVGEFEELQGIPSGVKPTKGTDFSESALKGVKAELVLAIYEVGQCFFQGWGVERDRTMGFVGLSCLLAYHTNVEMFQNYFLLAARLGDVDAQQELGFCYSNGKGCKKDRKEAARWYRAAVRHRHTESLQCSQ
jgi:TPR repeat protein